MKGSWYVLSAVRERRSWRGEVCGVTGDALSDAHVVHPAVELRISHGLRKPQCERFAVSADGARPIPRLPASMPSDVDYDWYVRRAEEMLREVGIQ